MLLRRNVETPERLRREHRAMHMQKPSKILPDDLHHLMATNCVLPQVALWGKGMVCAVKRTRGLNGCLTNQKSIPLYVGSTSGMELRI